MKITAAVARTKGGAFTLEQMDLDPPGPGEILVKIHSVGICHSDIAVRDQWLPVPLPAVLGHEGAGIIEAVGDGVVDMAPGDKVVLTFAYCGVCPSCATGHPAYCAEFVARNVSGGRPDGTNALRGDGDIHGFFFSQSSFATYAIATERNAVKVAPEADLSVLGPLGCGIQTGAGTVLNVLAPPSGTSMVVVGVGAVGLSAVMAAAVQGCDTIIAVDLKPSRLRQATELAATHTIDAGGVDDVVAEIREITGGGADFSVDTSANPKAARQAVECLGVLGTSAMVGLGPAGTELSVDILPLLLAGGRIVGATEGDAQPKEFIPRLMALQAEGRFPFEKLMRQYDFENINQACEDVESGAATKAVLRMPH